MQFLQIKFKLSYSNLNSIPTNTHPNFPKFYKIQHKINKKINLQKYFKFHIK